MATTKGKKTENSVKINKTNKKTKEDKKVEVEVEIVKENSVEGDVVEGDVVEGDVVEGDVVEGDVVEVKTKKVVDRDYILENIDSLVLSVTDEIENARQSPKVSNVKFLRMINKNLKQLRIMSAKVMKKKSKTVRDHNSNSGFLKPVGVSPELAKFIGWKPTELHSRVEVTKAICDYVKQNNLQNPEDRRIIEPDAKLQKLLGLTGSKDEVKFKYYQLQTHLKKHFV